MLITIGCILVGNFFGFILKNAMTLGGDVKVRHLNDPVEFRKAEKKRRLKIICNSGIKVFIVIVLAVFTMLFNVRFAVDTFDKNMYMRFKVFWICVPADLIIFEL